MTLQEIEAKLAEQEERIEYLERQVGRVKRHVGFTHLPPPARPSANPCKLSGDT